MRVAPTLGQFGLASVNKIHDFQGQTLVAGATTQSSPSQIRMPPDTNTTLSGKSVDTFGSECRSTSLMLRRRSVRRPKPSTAGSQKRRAHRGSPRFPWGPEFRLYLINSPKLFVEGNVYGMYFGGYGNFISTVDTVGWTLTKHLSANAGYQLGSRLVGTNNSSCDRIGLRLT
jgi:hypothetical protein